LGFTADLPCVIIFYGRVSPASQLRSRPEYAKLGILEVLFPRHGNE